MSIIAPLTLSAHSLFFVVFILVAAFSLLYLVCAHSRCSFPPNAPRKIQHDLPILGALRFFTERWEFWQHERAHSRTGNFSYYVGAYRMVGLSGHASRRAFLESK